jgi:hypothetical protein
VAFILEQLEQDTTSEKIVASLTALLSERTSEMLDNTRNATAVMDKTAAEAADKVSSLFNEATTTALADLFIYLFILIQFFAPFGVCPYVRRVIQVSSQQVFYLATSVSACVPWAFPCLEGRGGYGFACCACVFACQSVLFGVPLFLQKEPVSKVFENLPVSWMYLKRCIIAFGSVLMDIAPPRTV